MEPRSRGMRGGKSFRSKSRGANALQPCHGVLSGLLRRRSFSVSQEPAYRGERTDGRVSRLRANSRRVEDGEGQLPMFARPIGGFLIRCLWFRVILGCRVAARETEYVELQRSRFNRNRKV